MRGIELNKEQAEKVLKETMTSLKEFNAVNTAKHMGELRGWHVTRPINNKTEELMFAILLDPEKYTR